MLNRRCFLKIIAFSASLPASSYLLHDLIEQPPISNLYSSFYQMWEEHYGESPEDYLISIEKLIGSKFSYREKLKEDFFTGEIFEFEGLLLSKTEAAGLASFFKMGNLVL